MLKKVIPYQFETLVDMMNLVTKYCNENSEIFKNCSNEAVVNSYYMAKDAASEIRKNLVASKKG